MITSTYNDILFRAAELAGRTRDKVPVSEAVILQGALAVGLEDVWNGQLWPELIPDPVNVTPASAGASGASFSKNEGMAGEMGEILGVFTANPKATTKYRALGFTEGDGAVWIDESRASVWVEYMLPAPDLMGLSGNTLATYLIPRRFRNYLSFRGAAALVLGENAAQSGALLGLAESALGVQVRRLGAPPEWRQVRVRSGFGRRRAAGACAVS